VTTPTPSPEAVDLRPHTPAAEIVAGLRANPPRANLSESEERWRGEWDAYPFPPYVAYASQDGGG
jgi:hypothetical protein